MDTWTIVILGATGDLSRRQLFPALYELIKGAKQHYLVIGAARDQSTPDELLERARPFITHYDQKIFDQLRSIVFYQQLNFEHKQDFILLEREINRREHELGFSSENRIIYCAVAAQFYCPITRFLNESGIIQQGSDHHRVVYEKPFGWNLTSARQINTCIKQFLAPKQAYRIDHYLAKEFIGSILLIRFANIIFASLWNNTYIDHVQVFLNEAVCLEGRGTFYDAYGALKDVVQNHLLQIVALLAMDCPNITLDNDIAVKKADILKRIRVRTGVLGQYEGYRTEQGIAPDSTTETFAALQLSIDHERWHNVPFFIQTGKCLAEKLTEIRVFFKEIEPCIFQKKVVCPANILTIHVTPNEGFSLKLNSKKPGTQLEATSVTMDFCYECLFGPGTPHAYKVILEQVMEGDSSISVSSEEIEAQWMIIDTVKTLNLPVYQYTQKSQGPEEAQRLMCSSSSCVACSDKETCI